VVTLSDPDKLNVLSAPLVQQLKAILEELVADRAVRAIVLTGGRLRNGDVSPTTEVEDAVQEALLAAAVQWPRDDVPENPRGWLIVVASRRLIDELRSEHARRRREDMTAAMSVPEHVVAPGPADLGPPQHDDALTLLFLCCHPALTAASQIALTLRAVGGLNAAEIVGAFLVPETTMAQRISRAKQAITASQTPFVLPADAARDERLSVVLHVLYLTFNEGYTASSGPHIQRTGLAGEAIRLTRMLHRLLPEHGEVSGLLSLMLLTHARRRARRSLMAA
jgi:predicted RNA polymerase sigma factor